MVVLRNGIVIFLPVHSTAHPRSGRLPLPWIAAGLVFLAWLAGATHAALPTFENRTPVGFSPEDSTSQEDFVLG